RARQRADLLVQRQPRQPARPAAGGRRPRGGRGRRARPRGRRALGRRRRGTVRHGGRAARRRPGRRCRHLAEPDPDARRGPRAGRRPGRLDGTARAAHRDRGGHRRRALAVLLDRLRRSSRRRHRDGLPGRLRPRHDRGRVLRAARARRRRGGPAWTPDPFRAARSLDSRPVTLPLRPDLVGLEPYGAPQLDVPTLLNVNENPYQPPEVVVEAVVAAVREAAHGLNRYPDRDFLDLRAELAGYLATESGAVGLDASRVWAANGSNEVMLHVLQAFGGAGRVAMSLAPTFSMYPEYARETLTGWHVVPREPDFSIDPDAAIAEIRQVRPAVVLLASPNNPTGTALPIETTRRLAEATRDTGPDGAATVLVVDEAYAEFRREGTPSAVTLLPEHPHLAVARTMSKAFAYAGARIGYLAAAPELVDALRVVRLPYHLSAVTQAV